MHPSFKLRLMSLNSCKWSRLKPFHFPISTSTPFQEIKIGNRLCSTWCNATSSVWYWWVGYKIFHKNDMTYVTHMKSQYPSRYITGHVRRSVTRILQRLWYMSHICVEAEHMLLLISIYHSWSQIGLRGNVMIWYCITWLCLLWYSVWT